MNTSLCQKWNSSSSALQHLLFLQQLRLLCVCVSSTTKAIEHGGNTSTHCDKIIEKGNKQQLTTTKRGGTASVALLTLKNSSSRIPGGGEFSRFLQISWLLPPGKETNRDFVPRMRGQFYCPESVGEADHSSIMQETGLKFSAEYVCSS